MQTRGLFLVLAARRAVGELACKDLYGKSVDWWSGYKMPDTAANLTSPGFTLASWNAVSVETDNWFWQTIKDDYDEIGTTSLYHTTVQLP